jgi:hypothetical protein
MVLVMIVVSGAFMLGNETTQAYAVASVEVRLAERLGGAVSTCDEILRRAARDTLVLDSAPGTCRLDFQVADGYDDVASAVLWRPEQILFEPEPGEPVDGVDNDGDGMVDEGRVVHLRNPGLAGERRRILVSGVTNVGAGETAGNAADDDGDGLVDEPGFNLSLLGGRVVAELNLAMTIRGQPPVVRTVSRSIGVMN